MTRSRASVHGVALLTLALVIASVGIAFHPEVAGAATFGVTTTADGSDAAPGNGVCATAGGQCTLRAAIEEADANGVINDIVNVPAGTYTLTLGDLVITTSMFVDGDSASNTIVEPGGSERSFTIGDRDGLTSPISHISDLTIRDANLQSTDAGGGILVWEEAHLNLNRSIVRDNQSGIAGGGIHNRGSLAIFHSEIRDNTIGAGATTGGGVTSTGAGIYNAGDDAVLKLEDTTVAGNESSRGGGIANIFGRVELRNSTVSGNAVYEGGGGVYNVGNPEASPGSSGILLLSNSTITDNEANANGGGGKNRPWGGGVLNLGGAQTTIGKSILAGNTDNRSRFQAEYSPDCHSPEQFRMTSFGSNIIGVVNGNCLVSDIQGDQFGPDTAPLDPDLFALGANGGLARTHVPRSTSPAIDGAPLGGITSYFECTPQDQRDIPRPLDGDVDGDARCDIGAVERPPSDDGDGVGDAEEDGGPNGGDGNADGIPDRWQGNVATLRADAPGNPYVTMTVEDGQLIGNVDDIAIPPDAPAQVFPIGMFSLQLLPDDDGEVRLRMELPAGSTATRWWKYGPEPGEPSDHWWNFTYSPPTGLAGFGGVITVDFVDGGRGDADGVVNGSITDPGGPGKSLFCEFEEATIIGTSGNDTITGTPDKDVIVALGGNDTIDGLGGDDIICAGSGNDIVDAGPGADVVNGGSGVDDIRGGSGPDRLRGGGAGDTIHGGSDDDNLFGGDGDDVLKGGAGNDVLTGWSGDDDLRGGANDDELWGGDGDDVLSGWRGDDELGGGNGDDTLWGGQGDDELWGGAGYDVIRGGPGNDVAGNGEDVIT